MLSSREREQLAAEREPQHTEPRQPPRIKLGSSFYWLGLATLTPLAVPFLVLGKELTKPFKKQRY